MFLNREKTLYTWEKQIINDTSSYVHFLKFLTRKKKLAMCEIICVIFTVMNGKKVNERGNETLNELTVGKFNSFQVEWKPI